MPSTREHEFKVWPEEFAAIKRGDKRAEYRDLSDRTFEPFVGDVMVLREFLPDPGEVIGVHKASGIYSGNKITTRVTHVQSRMLPTNHRMISFQIIAAADA